MIGTIKDNTEALPTPGIEVLRAIVERHDIMQRAVDEYHLLNSAVYRLRGYIPSEQTMGAMEIIEYLHCMLREIAESELTKITTDPKLYHLRESPATESAPADIRALLAQHDADQERIKALEDALKGGE